MKTEKVLAGLFVLALALKFSGVPGANPLLIVSLGSLSIVYFMGPFYFFSGKGTSVQKMPLSILAALLLSVVPVAILFKLMYWPGTQPMLLASLVAAALALIAVFYFKSKRSEGLDTYYQNMFIRTGVLLTLAIVFNLVSTEMLLKLQYRNDPEMARLKSLYYQDNKNPEYKRQHDAYVMKQDSLHLDEVNRRNQDKGSL